ncbi:hypothetical protein PR048_009046 [Dryococelus australis]|uniref:Uncharacterized protein n=1 Tax=Dryococelus australis TaxID=614101 RepID=A0ABQ9HYS9_9NEOP|nr:hypothetical protein PR048_009046 [Dryococelus australis]
MSQGNMKSGFKATGICPFNPLIIPGQAFAPNAATELPPPEPATDEQDIAEHMPPESTFTNPTPGTSGSPQLPFSRRTPVTVTSTSCKRPRTPATLSTDSDVISPPADASDSSNNGEHEMSQTPDLSAKSSTRSSFTELFPMPLRKKKTTCNKKSAINSRNDSSRISKSASRREKPKRIPIGAKYKPPRKTLMTSVAAGGKQKRNCYQHLPRAGNVLYAARTR